MIYRLLADALVVVHFGFILFVVFGGLAVLRWRWLIWLHLPCAIYGAAIEFANWICPLTPLENWLRRAGGQAGYPHSFVEQYLLPVMYPAGLTRDVQATLGVLVCAVNVAAYAIVWRRWKRD